MSQIYLNNGGGGGPRGPLTITGDTGVATFTAGGNVKIYANNAANRNGATVSFINSGSTSFFTLSDALENTTIGIAAGSTTMTGTLNISLGAASSPSLTSGSFNIAIGGESFSRGTTASNNISIGYESHLDLISGIKNISIGNLAGSNYESNESYNINIGSAGATGDSNTTTIGFTNPTVGQSRCFIGGIINNTLLNPKIVVIDADDQLGVIDAFTPVPVTPLQSISDFDDFISSGEISKLDWAFAGLSKNQGTSSNPGLLVGNVLQTIAFICFSVATDLGNPWVLGGGTLSNSWVMDLISLSTVGNRYLVYIGITNNDDSWSSGNPTNGCFFKYSDNVNSGNWQLICIKAGVATTVNTAIPAATGFNNYTVSVNANASLATFFINGTSVGTIPTNIPLLPIGPTINLNVTAGTMPAFLIDLWYYAETLTTARPGDQGGGGMGGGNVSGPAASTDKAIVRWNGTSGTIIQDSVANLSDAGALSGLTALSVTGISTLNGGQVVKVTTPGAYPYTTLSSDYVILVDTSAARTITPLAGPTTGQTYRIKDNVGTAAANNITITPSGKNIDGAASSTINVNYGSIDIVYNGAEWNIL